jgi:hypothetical protein
MRMTSAQVFRRLLLQAAATACARGVRQMALTRFAYSALSKAGRFATASLRSRARAGFEMKVAKGVDKSMHDGGRNNHVKPNMRKNRNGKGKLKKTPIRETKVSEF